MSVLVAGVRAGVRCRVEVATSGRGQVVGALAEVRRRVEVATL